MAGVDRRVTKRRRPAINKEDINPKINSRSRVESLTDIRTEGTSRRDFSKGLVEGAAVEGEEADFEFREKTWGLGGCRQNGILGRWRRREEEDYTQSLPLTSFMRTPPLRQVAACSTSVSVDPGGG